MLGCSITIDDAGGIIGYYVATTIDLGSIRQPTDPHPHQTDPLRPCQPTAMPFQISIGTGAHARWPHNTPRVQQAKQASRPACDSLASHNIQHAASNGSATVQQLAPNNKRHTKTHNPSQFNNHTPDPLNRQPKLSMVVSSRPARLPLVLPLLPLVLLLLSLLLLPSTATAAAAAAGAAAGTGMPAAPTTPPMAAAPPSVLVLDVDGTLYDASTGLEAVVRRRRFLDPSIPYGFGHFN
jgi:hypothetical protein